MVAGGAAGADSAQASPAGYSSGGGGSGGAGGSSGVWVTSGSETKPTAGGTGLSFTKITSDPSTLFVGGAHLN